MSIVSVLWQDIQPLSVKPAPVSIEHIEIVDLEISSRPLATCDLTESSGKYIYGFSINVLGL